MPKAKGTFHVTAGDEKTYEELSGQAKLTRAHIDQDYDGDLRGRGTWDLLMCYRDDGTAAFTGFGKFEGDAAVHKAAFVMENRGTCAGHQPAVGLLRRVLGLTSCGTVRLLDGLVAAGYVERGAGADGRATLSSLTPAGRAAAVQMAAARGKVLEQALGPLSSEERRSLEKLTSKLLIGLMQ